MRNSPLRFGSAGAAPRARTSSVGGKGKIFTGRSASWVKNCALTRMSRAAVIAPTRRTPDDEMLTGPAALTSDHAGRQGRFVVPPETLKVPIAAKAALAGPPTKLRPCTARDFNVVGLKFESA